MTTPISKVPLKNTSNTTSSVTNPLSTHRPGISRRRRRVNRKIDKPQHATGQIIPHRSNFHKRIIPRGIRLGGEDAVVDVGRKGIGVEGVGRDFVDLGEGGLVEEELACEGVWSEFGPSFFFLDGAGACLGGL